MYRFFEMLPGILTWTTLIAIVVCSWAFPSAVSFFIILFDIYWLLKTVYLSLHLRVTFNHMRANMKVNWLEELKNRESSLPGQGIEPARPGNREGGNDKPTSHFSLLTSPSWTDIYHLVIFPMYKEPYEVVKESFESLAKVNYPKDRFLVVLATEGRAGEVAEKVANQIKEEFKDTFAKLLVTVHPADIPGELAGKGANESWAAKQALRECIDPLGIPYENILASVFDVDTQNYPDYFSRLTYLYLKEEDRAHAIYQPVPIFVNNIYEAPALARVVAFCTTFWQMMQQARPERLTSFSSQSVPFKALVDMGFWDTDVVSEDSHVFWQGYLHYDGNFRVVPMEYPVSMDANVMPTFWGTMKSLYKQHRRWAWGAENVPYMLEGFRLNPRIKKSKKWFWGFISVEGYHSWATNTLMIFALGWLPVLIGAGDFRYSYLSFSLPRLTRLIIGLSTIGIAASAVLTLFMLPKTSEKRSIRYLGYFLEWILVPITLIVFGSIPAIDSQTRLLVGGKYRLGFWVTPKGRYRKIGV
jgi:cellulose synthase/poly-beta-1,6-N-acetylglucosamine synthase-like glycosyltransferase